ncbi:MAG: antibiotic biosynthesis monooxygenase [Ruminococcus sp.]|nr:antibiotic biosynthesis monooxygenase [Ruminococcus sp.]
MKRLVEVNYRIKDGKRAEFYNEIISRGIAASARAEEGNEKYEYYFSPENENELLLLEIWSSAESVKLHMETPHYKELTELKKEYVIETEFTRYEITEI